MTPKFYAFWAINARLDLQKLNCQLDEMKRFGFDGAVWHPRFYPNEPEYLGAEYLEILSDAILYAKSQNLEFWIYDENGYPSGTAGGKTLKDFPELANCWLDLTRRKSENCVREFQNDGETFYLEKRIGCGVDYFNPRLAEKFLENTYERYRTGLRAEAFEYVTTFFCDEPEFGLGHAYAELSPLGAIPWSEKFDEKYGENLIEKLPELFFETGDYRETRIKFREFLTDSFVESFIKPMNDWCASHGKIFTAHVKGEEHPLFQISMNGSVHQVFQNVGLPAIDALERFPSGDFFPRQIVSVAAQFGNGNSMVECFGGAGWGASPADFENYLTWLAGHGINHFVPHLWQYELSTHAMRDWSPSIPKDLNWRGVFPQILDRVRKSFAEQPAADLLVVAPYRGIAAELSPSDLLETNIHNAATYPDTKAGNINTEFLKLIGQIQKSGENYHVCDERTVEEHGEIADGALKIGNCFYSKIIVAGGAMLNADGRSRIADLTRSREAEIQVKPKISDEKPVELSTLEVDWKIVSLAKNDFVLEAERIAENVFKAIFQSKIETKAELFFLDETNEIFVNGKPINRTEKFVTEIGANEIVFKCAVPENLIPFVSVRGDFGVYSFSEFDKSANGTIKTKGDFFVDSHGETNPNDLIKSGLPFYRETVIVCASIFLERESNQVEFTGTDADCLKIKIDEIDRGWIWGDVLTLGLDENLSQGNHRIELELVPNTFNFFGPHHHIDGDIKVVSPAQFDYVKNFADRRDAPENTRAKFWNFRSFGVGKEIKVASSAKNT